MQNCSRIVVVGTCGAGKTSFAKAVAGLLKIPHVELDEHYWSENWQRVPDDQFRAFVVEQAQAPYWVMDGNYSIVRDALWNRADTIVWLDYSFVVTMRRLVTRSLCRILGRTTTWHGNVETWARLFSKQSIIWWGISTFSRRRREYGKLWRRKELSNTRLVRFKDPSQAETWLQQIV